MSALRCSAHPHHTGFEDEAHDDDDSVVVEEEAEAEDEVIASAFAWSPRSRGR